MDDILALRAELEARISSVKRAQRIHVAYTAAVFIVGAGMGYAIAHGVIDPITVFLSCGGMQA